MRSGRLALVLVFSAALAACVVVIVRQSSRLAAYERQHAADERDIAKLRASVHMPPSQPATAVAPHSGSVMQQPPGRASVSEAAALAARNAAIEQLKRELDEAHASVARLQAQVQSAEEGQQKALAAAGDDARKREQDLQQRLDGVEQELDSARAGMQAARERAAALDAENARIRNENGANSSHVAELRKNLATLQDLDRRRDAYLSSIVRRYRDITEQFRSMTGELDSSRGPGSSAFSGVALSRIQNAISLAEDDLRRLNELNAQAHQIASRLAKN
jgi:chromosome segregation ATPase